MRTDEALLALLLILVSALVDFGDVWKAALLHNVVLSDLVLLGLLLTQHQASERYLNMHNTTTF